MLSVQTLTVGPLEENCYLLRDTETGEAVIVDPGDEAERLLAALGSDTLTGIWLTHAHFDHVGALAAIYRRFAVPVYLHPDDTVWLENVAAGAAMFGLVIEQPDVPTLPLVPGQPLRIGEHEATCLFTPGHAPGHIAFYFAAAEVVLAGDALFRGSVGRTDLPGGDGPQLLESIRRELLVLPDDTRVLPGHGPETTIGLELRTNPFLL